MSEDVRADHEHLRAREGEGKVPNVQECESRAAAQRLHGANGEEELSAVRAYAKTQRRGDHRSAGHAAPPHRLGGPGLRARGHAARSQDARPPALSHGAASGYAWDPPRRREGAMTDDSPARSQDGSGTAGDREAPARRAATRRAILSLRRGRRGDGRGGQGGRRPAPPPCLRPRRLDLLTDPSHTAPVIGGRSLARLILLTVRGGAACEVGRLIPPFG